MHLRNVGHLTIILIILIKTWKQQQGRDIVSHLSNAAQILTLSIVFSSDVINNNNASEILFLFSSAYRIKKQFLKYKILMAIILDYSNIMISKMIVLFYYHG